jgi:hypothetical protein
VFRVIKLRHIKHCNKDRFVLLPRRPSQQQGPSYFFIDASSAVKRINDMQSPSFQIIILIT